MHVRPPPLFASPAERHHIALCPRHSLESAGVAQVLG